ncbi:MAG: peptidoglycan bridge formation glycyltransferase FemA/FemB family protein [Oscillospiraceae bacterium]
MEILSPSDYDEFDRFCQNHPHGAFQQSPNWGKVKKEWKNEIVVSRSKTGEIVGGVSVLIRKIGPFAMMYAPRGPVCDYSDTQVLSDLLSGVQQLAKQYNAYKFICDPLVLAGDTQTIDTFKGCGLDIKLNAAFHDTIQPRYNYMLNYIKCLTEDELIKKFTSGTRYYIRFGPKNGVECRQGIEYLDDFYSIYEETGKRKKFAIRAKSYLEGILTAFPDNARLFMCYFEDKPLCGGIALQYAGTTSHVYGCSTGEMRKLNPTYMMQWEMMKWALSANCHTYDMQGIAPDKETDEELYNVYMFKAKFLGDVVETAGEFTITFNKPVEKLIDFALAVRSKLK